MISYRFAVWEPEFEATFLGQQALIAISQQPLANCSLLKAAEADPGRGTDFAITSKPSRRESVRPEQSQRNARRGIDSPRAHFALLVQCELPT